MLSNPTADAYARNIAASLHVEPVLGPPVPGDKRTRWIHPVTEELHRVGAPAAHGLVRGEAWESWYINGIRHRDDGPAVIRPTHQVWYRNGVPHRLDGPAWDDPTSPEWFVNGHQVTAASDCADLAELYEAGRLRELELVLRLWRPDGPPVADLAAAVAAAIT